MTEAGHNLCFSAAADFTSLTSNMKFPFSSYFLRAEANVQTRFTSSETAYARFYIIKNELTVVTRSWLRSTVLFCSGGLLLAGKTGSYVVWFSPMVTTHWTQELVYCVLTAVCCACAVYTFFIHKQQQTLYSTTPLVLLFSLTMIGITNFRIFFLKEID